MDDSRVAPLWLFATDFSPEAEEAAVETAQELQRLDGTLALLHAYNLPPAVMPLDAPSLDCIGCAPHEIEGAVHADAEEQLLRLKQRLERRFPDLLVETLARPGPPTEAILDAARELDVDRIVLYTHGRTGLRHFVAGSIAERVARRAPMPVLVVKVGHEHHAPGGR